MKLKYIAYACSLLLSMQVMAQNKTGQQLSIPLSEPGKPFKLDVHLMNGPIKIEGYDGKEIIIDAQPGENSDNEEKQSSNGMRKIPAGNIMDLSAEEKNNRVTIHSNSVMKMIRLSLKIPRGAGSLNIGSINNGEIEVTDATGEMEISTVNGNITLTNVSGSIVANTINGNVNVSFKTMDVKAPMAFSTLSGNVDVTFPAGLKADMKLKTDRGDMFTDFDIAASQPQPAVKTSGSGMTHVHFDDWMRGKIGGGGQEIMMKTMTGNIYIRKVK